MLTKEQMNVAEVVFNKAKDILFAAGGFPQAYAIFYGERNVAFFPLPLDVPIGSSVGIELAKEFSEVEGAKLIMFITEAWTVIVEDPDDEIVERAKDGDWQEAARNALPNGKPPSEQPDKEESLIMLVLEPKTHHIHMLKGKIERDIKGNPYVRESDWVSSNDLSLLKTTAFPQVLHS